MLLLNSCLRSIFMNGTRWQAVDSANHFILFNKFRELTISPYIVNEIIIIIIVIMIIIIIIIS